MTAKQEFDEYARRYEALHNDNLSVVGADSQEFLAAKLAFCERFIRTHVRFIPGGKLFLDYGCGTGRLGHLFHDRFDADWCYVGVDPSEESIKEAQAADARGQCRYHSLTAWQSGSETYDFALVACVLHHVPPGDRPSVLRSVWDRMKPGAALVIWEHNPWNPVTRRIVDACPFDKDAVLLALPEMKKLWAHLGTESITGSSYVTFFPGPLRRLRPLERFLAWLPLGGQWVFWARKQ
ncbi:class I SAM-dependent methyltransferase [Nitrospira moscoviensis]|uniref:Putative SAM-dependent methyltransferase n=1 Tax=Nitrospira moscoviensis TaxID=42253 RepID=A0A0K2GFN0_NITMO|nr:class I SAM-dependent methyltransferase [Nitrospira moscoviensis]ALA59768.1 putative SAM-dependent methyltransferase [Nitrospira moscoviensis]